MVDDFTARRIKRHLRPETVKSNLTRAASVLAAHQMLRDQIVDRVRGFLSMTGAMEHQKSAPTYRDEVLSRGPNEVAACLEWLVGAGAITADDVEVVERLWRERNRVAHELPNALIDPNFPVDQSVVGDAAAVSQAIARFWGGISMDADPAYDGLDTDAVEIESGASLLIGYLAELAGSQ